MIKRVVLLGLALCCSMAAAKENFYAGLSFGDNRKAVESKLRACKYMVMSADERFLGRTGLNEAFKTKYNLGKTKYALSFNFEPADALNTVDLYSTVKFPEDQFAVELQPEYENLVAFLSEIYGKPASAVDLPSPASVQVDALFFTHEWQNAAGYNVRAGIGRSKKGYFLVIQFSDVAQ